MCFGSFFSLGSWNWRIAELLRAGPRVPRSQLQRTYLPQRYVVQNPRRHVESPFFVRIFFMKFLSFGIATSAMLWWKLLQVWGHADHGAAFALFEISFGSSRDLSIRAERGSGWCPGASGEHRIRPVPKSGRLRNSLSAKPAVYPSKRLRSWFLAFSLLLLLLLFYCSCRLSFIVPCCCCCCWSFSHQECAIRDVVFSFGAKAVQ